MVLLNIVVSLGNGSMQTYWCLKLEFEGLNQWIEMIAAINGIQSEKPDTTTQQ